MHVVIALLAYLPNCVVNGQISTLIIEYETMHLHASDSYKVAYMHSTIHLKFCRQSEIIYIGIRYISIGLYIVGNT